MVEIGQESHQLLVGIEVVRPGEIIARKDVLQKAKTKNGVYSFRCVMDVLLKRTTPRKKMWFTTRTPATLGLLNIFIPRITHTRNGKMKP